jgi:hypothetical protein
MAANTALILVPSSTITATGNGSAIAIEEWVTNAILYVTVGTVTGTTPSMTVKLQGSVDGTNFVDLITGAAITTSSTVQTTIVALASVLIPMPPYFRAAYTVTGTTPSFASTVIKAYVE